MWLHRFPLDRSTNACLVLLFLFTLLFHGVPGLAIGQRPRPLSPGARVRPPGGDGVWSAKDCVDTVMARNWSWESAEVGGKSTLRTE